jgi:hypothetical protein
LKVNNQFRENIHPFDQVADIAGSTLLNVQVVVDFPARGDQIITIVSGKPDQIFTRELVAPVFFITKGLCTKMIGAKYQFELSGII